MEKTERELLNTVVANDPHLKKLYFKHNKLNKEVERIGDYTIYSSSAALRMQQLKKDKLKTKEDILNILEKYKRKRVASA